MKDNDIYIYVVIIYRTYHIITYNLFMEDYKKRKVETLLNTIEDQDISEEDNWVVIEKFFQEYGLVA